MYYSWIMDRKALFIIISLLFLFPWASSAKAYIDPGTGSYILQVVAGLFFACIFVLKSYWQAFKAFFTSAKEVEVSPEDVDES